MRYACVPPVGSQSPFRLYAREPDALASLMDGCVARLRLSTRVLHRFFRLSFPSALPAPLPPPSLYLCCWPFLILIPI